MKKEYRISRIIIVMLVMVVTFFAFINEDISLRIFATALFMTTALLAVFLGSRVSLLMIKMGDRIRNKIVTVIYYICLPIILICLVLLVWAVMEIVVSGLPDTGNFGSTVGQVYLCVMVAIAECIFIIIPYVQTIIVLILRKISKE